MKSATRPVPRFRLGQWVSYLYVRGRMLAQIIEDVGPIGAGRRQLYGLRVEQSQEEPRTTVMPEEDLQPAPAVMTVETARKSGFHTQNWPRQVFQVSYTRQAKTRWRAAIRRAQILEPGKALGAVSYSTARWESEAAGDERHATVLVVIEIDPRLLDADPGDHQDVWDATTEAARKRADERFKMEHPNAVIQHA